MRASMLIPALLGASVLAGCATAPITAPPQVVTIKQVRYLPLPTADLISCAYPVGNLHTNLDLLMLEQFAVRSLQVCNKQLEDLRALDAKARKP